MIGPAALMVLSLAAWWFVTRPRPGAGPYPRIVGDGSLGSGQIVFPDPGQLPAGALLPERVYWMAAEVIQAHGFNARPGLVAAMAYVESTYRPWLIGDKGSSLGLMQVKLSTAADLAANWGYIALGQPTREDLFDARTSLYFAAGYLDWMSRYAGTPRPEDQVVQAYNVGPTAYFRNGVRAPAYLSRVRAAERRYITGA